MCRGPCALAPDAPPEAGPAQSAAGSVAPAAGSYSSYGVVGVQFRPYPVVAQPEVPSLEYHEGLTELLIRNGFVENGLPEMFIRVLGIEQTKELQFFTADDIREKFSGEIVDKFLRLHYQVIEHYRDE
jgi:hypothetical protein